MLVTVILLMALALYVYSARARIGKYLEKINNGSR